MSTIEVMSMHRRALPNGEVEVTVRLPSDAAAEKLYAFMGSDAWEKAEALRDARHEDCLKSIEHCFNLQRQHAGTSGGRVMASFLASLYNGNRVKVDVSDIRRLDVANFEHLMNALRLSFEAHAEPHTFFKDGGRLFEEMIERWGLEKKRRRS